MARIHINWKFVIVCIIGITVIVATAIGLNHWQRKLTLDARLNLAEKASSENLWSQAAQNLGRYLAIVKNDRPLDHTDIPIPFKYARACLNIRPLKQPNVQQAIGAYRSILRIQKENTNAAENVAQIYLQINLAGEAQLVLQRVPKENQTPKSRRLLATALATQRKFAPAAKELKALLTEHPNEILAYETLGRIVEQQAEEFPESPRYWFNQAVEKNPSAAMAYIIRAAFHLRHRRSAQALADLKTAENCPDIGFNQRLRLAREMLKADNATNAEKHLKIAKSIDPTSQFLWQTWAILALQSNSKQKMYQTARAGLENLSAQPWDFMPTAAELFIRAGRLEEAAHCIDKLKTQDIAPDRITFLQGLLAQEKQDIHRAVKYWRKTLDAPAASPAMHLTLANALWTAKDRQSAVAQLRTLLSKQHDSFTAHLTLAGFAAQTEDWHLAASHAKKAFQLDPNNLNAALLHTQLQIQLLKDAPTSHDAPIFQKLQTRITDLRTSGLDTLTTGLMRFQLALARRDFDHARLLITQLSKTEKPDLQIIIAEADLYIATNQIDTSISTLNRAINQYPASVLPVKKLARILIRENRFDHCERVVKNALATVETSGDKSDLALILAHVYTLAGKTQQACSFITALSEQMSNDIPLKRQLLQYDSVRQNPAAAQKIIDDIRRLEGEPGWQWRYEQARLWFDSSRFESLAPQIISLLRENLDANCYDQPSRLLLAATQQKAGNLSLAVAGFREALNYEPDNLGIVVALVQALQQARQHDQADRVIQQAAATLNSDPESLKLQIARFNNKSIFEFPANQVNIPPADDPKITMQSALSLHAAGRLSQAAQLYQNVLQHEPNNVVAINNLAWIICRHENDPKRALVLAQKALAISPEYADLLDTSGVARYQLGNFDEAIGDFQKSLKLRTEPTSATAASHLHLAKALAALNRRDEAKQQLLSALDLHQQIRGLSPDEYRKAQQLLAELQQ